MLIGFENRFIYFKLILFLLLRVKILSLKIKNEIRFGITPNNQPYPKALSSVRNPPAVKITIITNKNKYIGIINRVGFQYL